MAHFKILSAISALAATIACGTTEHQNPQNGAASPPTAIGRTAKVELALTNGAGYSISPSASGGAMCLDVRGSSQDNGSIIQLMNCREGNNQIFVRKGHALQVFGDKCLDVKDGQSYSGGKVQLWDCIEGSPHQAWESHGKSLRLKNSNVCLDVTNGLMNPGAGLQVWQCDEVNNNQQFLMTSKTSGASRSATDNNTVPNTTGRKIVWSDEFDGASIDSNKWQHEVNCDGGGNQEEECYTNDTKNSFIKDNMLHIKVIKEDDQGKAYTSARITTQGLADWTYGRFETRLKVPCGQGFWPAAWMLPSDNSYGSWPQSGELDIMEILGGAPDTLHGTAHFGDPAPNNRNKGGSYSMSSGDYCGDFHVFAVERTEDTITWSVDGEDYFSLGQKDADYSPASGWPFDKKFYRIGR